MARISTNTIDQIKAWLFPIIISIFTGYIWQDIREIKNDVKALMAQSNIDKTRIDNLERQVFSKTVVPFKEKNKKKEPLTNLLVNSELWADTRQKKIYKKIRLV